MLSSLFSIWWVALSLVEGTQMQHTSLYGLMHIAQWVYDYHETRCPILTKGNLLRLQNIFIAERKEKRHRVYFLLLVFFYHLSQLFEATRIYCFDHSIKRSQCTKLEILLYFLNPTIQNQSGICAGRCEGPASCQQNSPTTLYILNLYALYVGICQDTWTLEPPLICLLVNVFEKMPESICREMLFPRWCRFVLDKCVGATYGPTIWLS